MCQPHVLPPSVPLRIRQLGLCDYQAVLQRMRAFTNERGEGTVDELWLVEHPPVFTQGQAGKAEHLRAVENIPVVLTERGGQVTYHGPGQLVAYPLLNLKRLHLGVRDLVTLLENSVVNLLRQYGVAAWAKSDAPGVYVGQSEGDVSGKQPMADRKIASLGLRIRRGCSFHGVALNVDMDLSPFLQINPCGYEGLEVTQLANEIESEQILQITEVGRRFAVILAAALHMEIAWQD